MIKRSLSAAIAVSFLALTFASAADGHYVRHNYVMTHDCTKYKDPVTIVFQGEGAHADRVLRDVRKHTGWRWSDPDEVFGQKFFQSFHSHGNCHRQTGERASRPAPGLDRYHVRLFALPDRAENRQLYTFLTPHKEDWVVGRGCGAVGSHAVEPGHADPDNRDNQYYGNGYYSGFDHGRDKLLNKLTTGRNPHHRINTALWRNTRSFKQCKSGWYAGASGRVFGVTMGR